MYYSVFKSIEQKKQYEVENNFIYDVVFRIRMDTIFDSVIPIDDINKVINDKVLLVGWFGTPEMYPHQDITDIFAFSTSQNMDIYGNAYHFWHNNRHLKSEGVIHNHLKNENINVQWSSTTMKILGQWNEDRVMFYRFKPGL